MAQTELEVRLSADLRRLKRELKKAKGELVDFGDAAKKSNNDLGKSFDTVNKKTANATPTLQEFSRVIQDAPFGIQGVANNIQQLTSNFTNLQKSAGGTIPALRLLAGSFAGPAGILFAVSAVTSLLVTYADKLKFAASETKLLAKATEEFTQGALKEVGENKRLLETAQNLSNSYVARSAALDELKKKYPEYLRNIDLETINTDEARVAVNKLNKSLIEKAKIQGLESRISDVIESNSKGLTNALIQQEKAAEDIRVELGRLNEKYKDYIKVNQDLPNLGAQVADVFSQINKNLGGTKGGLGDRLKELRDIYQKTSQEVAKESLKIEKSTDALQGAIDKISLKNLSNLPNEFQLDEIVLTPKDVKINATGAEKGIKDFGQKVNTTLGSTNISFTPIAEQLSASANQVVTTIKTKGLEMTNAARLFKESFSQAFVGQEIGNAISTFANTIGQGLASGANLIDSIGAGILGSFGQFLSAFGQQLIQYGIAAGAFAKVSAALSNPLTAAPAAAAAIAIGSALSLAGSALSNIAGKGLGASNTFNGSSTSGTPFDINRSGAFEDVVFKIQGQTLVGAINRQNNLRGRFG